MPRLSSLSQRSLTNVGIKKLLGLLPSVTSFFGDTGQNVTVNSPRLSLISTEQARFGTRSLQKTPVSGLSGRANAVNVPLSQILGAPMTLEAWVWIGAGYSSPTFQTGPSLLLHGPTAVDYATTNPSNSIFLDCFGPNTFGSSASTGLFTTEGTSISDQNNTPIPLNTWTHIALSYSDSTNLAVWVNGTRRIRTAWSSGYSLEQVMTQLTLNSRGSVGPHYIDEIRVSNIDRYGVNNTTIAVPTTRFISDVNTVALVNFEPAPMTYSGSAIDFLIADLADYGIRLDPITEQLSSLDGYSHSITSTERISSFIGNENYRNDENGVSQTYIIPAVGFLQTTGWVGQPRGFKATSITFST